MNVSLAEELEKFVSTVTSLANFPPLVTSVKIWPIIQCFSWESATPSSFIAQSRSPWKFWP
jgi:hypothetical protein